MIWKFKKVNINLILVAQQQKDIHKEVFKTSTVLLRKTKDHNSYSIVMVLSAG